MVSLFHSTYGIRGPRIRKRELGSTYMTASTGIKQYDSNVPQNHQNRRLRRRPPLLRRTYHLPGGRTYTHFDATIVRITAHSTSSTFASSESSEIEGWGEFTPFVDANCGLTPEHALRMLRLLPPGLDFVLESPCATWRERMGLRERTDVPVIFDELATSEAGLIHMIADDAVEGIGLKISKAGGLTRARRQRDMCIAAGYTVSVQDTTGSDISFAAIVHLAQTVPEKNLRCVLNSRGMVTLKTADTDFEGDGKAVKAGKMPGLGVRVRVEVFGEPVASHS